mgnify:CR=1 FL=1
MIPACSHVFPPGGVTTVAEGGEEGEGDDEDEVPMLGEWGVEEVGNVVGMPGEKDGNFSLASPSCLGMV